MVEVRSGWGFPTIYQGQREGSYPFYKVSDMNIIGNETIMDLANNYIDDAVIKKLRISLAPEGTVIFPKIGAAVATNKKRLLSLPSAYDNNVMGLIPKENIISGFLFYWIQTINLTTLANDSGAVPSIRKSTVEAHLIPIPCPDNPEKSLKFQNEIVHILDTFRGLTTELTTELALRKKQYNYYREELLTFDEREIKHLPMDDEDVGEFIRGKRFVKTDMISEGVPCIHYGEMYTHYGTRADKTKSFVSKELVERKNLRRAEKGDVVIVAAGETIEDIGQGTAWLGEEGVVIHDACFYYKSTLNPKYVAYFTRTRQFHDQIRKHIRTGKISAINAKGLGKTIIPIPPIEEQERIVTILDKFDILAKRN